MHHRYLRPLRALFVAVALTGCGGPLAHTVDVRDIPSERRGELANAEHDVELARARRDEANAAAERSVDALDAAESDVETREGDLAIAEKQVELEEAKDDAGRDARVREAEGSRERAKQALARTKAALGVARAQKERDAAQAEEARRAWLTALAQLELQKAKELGGAEPERSERMAQFEEQLADEQGDLADARKELREREEALADARAELADVE